jgi:hypothetical protein
MIFIIDPDVIPVSTAGLHSAAHESTLKMRTGTHCAGIPSTKLFPMND